MQLSYWKIFKYVWDVWVCESTLSTVNSIYSKYRANIPDENLVSKLKCSVCVKFTPNLKT